MARAILSSFVVAALLSVVAGSHALGGDFDTSHKNSGTPTRQAGKGATGANQTLTIGGAQAPGVKLGSGEKNSKSISLDFQKIPLQNIKTSDGKE